MKTLQDEWVRYRTACYPEAIPGTQNAECEQAFFSGALSVLALFAERASETDANSGKEFMKLFVETTVWGEQRKAELQRRSDEAPPQGA